MPFKDITKKRFGRLVAIERTNIKSPHQGYIWKFECDCGNICYAPIGFLSKNRKQSCGCMCKEQMEKDVMIEARLKLYKEINADGVNLWKLFCYEESEQKCELPYKGLKGVTYNGNEHRYRARIGYKGKIYHLGRYDTANEARKAYLEAKKKYQKIFLEEHPEYADIVKEIQSKSEEKWKEKQKKEECKKLNLDDKKLEEEILHIIENDKSVFSDLTEDDKLNMATQFANSVLLKYNITNRKHKVIGVFITDNEELSPELVKLNGEKSLTFTFDNNIDMEFIVTEKKSININFYRTNAFDTILISNVKEIFNQ